MDGWIGLDCFGLEQKRQIRFRYSRNQLKEINWSVDPRLLSDAGEHLRVNSINCTSKQSVGGLRGVGGAAQAFALQLTIFESQ